MLSMVENILLLILNVVMLSLQDFFFRLFFIILVWRTWISASPFNIETGV